jgi:phosphoglycolate phosphatase-like HAD superfamily hydrolase
VKRPRKLLLFDIDGTLVDTGGAGLVSLREGFHEAFPEHRDDPFPPLELGGATDHGIVRGLFGHFGIEDDGDRRRRFFSAYTARLGDRLEIFSREGRGRVLPGVAGCLAHLSRHDGYCLGLLTGNLREGAEIKLRHYGLDHHFTPEAGAYGDDHHDRNELGPIARHRASGIFGEDFAPEHIVVIGDTTRDIACARAFGAKVLAVATGAATREELERGEPDALLESLADFGEVERCLEA